MAIKECLPRLTALGISLPDAEALRRISMTLHRWHELECGDGDQWGSWTIARGNKANGAFEYNDEGAPYIEYHAHDRKEPRYTRVPDRERGALRRMAAVMARYPTLTAYVQGDPRGASLYVLRPSDLPEGAPIDSFYTRGVAVYK